ncbi:hypothetical protein BD289DRAFT_448063 [Coniella lustricola]|uniref:Uncharacterized protein n=1 Tax=Coniella lustricola TaxID=2025994 RepID=A0A2T2ZSH3_9PEZI|nr:hypothetical protein BD289DRAFT_448063 [Coniella lustricola]
MGRNSLSYLGSHVSTIWPLRGSNVVDHLTAIWQKRTSVFSSCAYPQTNDHDNSSYRPRYFGHHTTLSSHKRPAGVSHQQFMSSRQDGSNALHMARR